MSDRVERRPGLTGDFRPSYRPQKRSAFADMRSLGVLAAAFGGGVALAVGAATLVRHSHAGIPVVEPEAGPVRIKPIDPGGMTVTGGELAPATAVGTTSLAPAAEQPQIAALRAQLRAVKKELARQAAENDAAVKLAQAARAQAKVVATPPPTRTSVEARIPAILAPQEAPGVQVQLAAFSDAQAARIEWQTLVAQSPDLFAHRDPSITQVTIGGRTMWRLRTGPFRAVNDAIAFCARAHTDCEPAK